MKILMILMIILFMAIYGGINYYIGIRGWHYLGSYVPFINRSIYWIIFWVVALAYIIAMLCAAYVPSLISSAFNIVGSYWMAIMFYLIILLPVIDVMIFLNRRMSFIPQRVSESVKVSLIMTITIMILMVGLMVYGTWSGISSKVTKYNFNIDKKAGSIDGLKVVMVSDLHLGSIIDNSRLTQMVDSINELNPDIVLMAGDIIDNKLEPFVKEKMGNNFNRLKSKYGVYACLGNHDGMSDNKEEIIKQYQEAGINVLRDKSVLINDSFYVIGREDLSIGRSNGKKREALSKIVEGLDNTKPILLMDHQPQNLSEPEKYGIDLQVSGHTHRGQFIPINLITSKMFEIDFGYLKKGNLNVVVSSGYGTWGPPIRIGSRSEIVEINLNFTR